VKPKSVMLRIVVWSSIFLGAVGSVVAVSPEGVTACVRDMLESKQLKEQAANYEKKCGELDCEILTTHDRIAQKEQVLISYSEGTMSFEEAVDRFLVLNTSASYFIRNMSTINGEGLSPREYSAINFIRTLECRSFGPKSSYRMSKALGDDYEKMFGRRINIAK